MSFRKKNITEKDVRKNRTGGGKQAVALKLKNKNAPLITVSNAHLKMTNFTKFYKDNYIVPEGEWRDFLQGVLTRPPVVFRIPRSHMICNNMGLAKKGAVSQAEVLLEKFKLEVLPDIAQQQIDGKQCEMNCLEWYPKELAWQANFDNEQMKESELRSLMNFLFEETSGFNVMKHDVNSMIPPMLLDVKPHHKVLDMFGSPGWMAAHLSEDLYAGTKAQYPTGFLVVNDNDQTKMQWRWMQGPNFMFLHHDAKYLPWLYKSKQHTPENRILFDKIMCDVPCSDDGQLGKNAFNRTLWNMRTAFNNHKTQKKFLQRAVELLAPNGDIVYTTTSMNPIENEAVVASILRMSAGSLKLKDVHSKLPGFKKRHGLSKWKVMTDAGVFIDDVVSAPESFLKAHDESVFAPVPEEAKMLELEKCMRVFPHDNNTPGFFCALITRVGKLPWVSVVGDSKSTGESMEVEHKAPKPVYVKPFKYVFDVNCTEIEWTTEETNQKLETKTTSAVESFEKPEPKLMKQSILMPKRDVQKDYFLKEDDRNWEPLKEFYGLTDAIKCGDLFARGGRGSFHLYLHSPVIKQLLEANENIHPDNKHKNSGCKVFRLYKNPEAPDSDFVIAEQGIMALFPYMKKRIVTIDREQLDLLLTNTTVKIEDLKDNFKDILPEECGCTVFHYVPPKGKAADPKCEIFLVGWKGKTQIKAETDAKTDIVHFLRLCGIDNPNKKRKDTKMDES